MVSKCDVTTHSVFQAVSRLMDQATLPTMDGSEDAEDDEASTAERRHSAGRAGFTPSSDVRNEVGGFGSRDDDH